MPKIRDAMTKRLVTIDEERTVSEACKVMGRERVGSLIVTSEGKHVGIFTERDLLSKLLVKDCDLTHVKVKDYTSRPLTVIKADLDLKEAARVMSQLGIRRLPVVEDGRLIGIITSSDLVKAISEAPLEF